MESSVLGSLMFSCWSLLSILLHILIQRPSTSVEHFRLSVDIQMSRRSILSLLPIDWHTSHSMSVSVTCEKKFATKIKLWTLTVETGIKTKDNTGRNQFQICIKGAFINDVTQNWRFFTPLPPLSHSYTLSIMYLCLKNPYPLPLFAWRHLWMWRVLFRDTNKWSTIESKILNWLKIQCSILLTVPHVNKAVFSRP